MFVNYLKVVLAASSLLLASCATIKEVCHEPDIIITGDYGWTQQDWNNLEAARKKCVRRQVPCLKTMVKYKPHAYTAICGYKRSICK